MELALTHSRELAGTARADGSEKWIDFAAEFWHCQCISQRSETTFSNRYLKWCRKHGCNFTQEKMKKIYAVASSAVGVMPMSETTKLLVEQTVLQLKATSSAVVALRGEMNALAGALPEYQVVMEMFGVGPSLGPQLI